MRSAIVALACVCAVLASGAARASTDEIVRDGIRERESRLILRTPSRIEPDLSLGRQLLMPPRVTLEQPRYAPIGAEARVHFRGGLLPLGMVLEAISMSVGYTPMYVRRADDQLVGLVPDLNEMHLSNVLELLGRVYGVAINEMPEPRLIMVTPNVRPHGI